MIELGGPSAEDVECLTDNPIPPSYLILPNAGSLKRYITHTLQREHQVRVWRMRRTRSEGSALAMYFNELGDGHLRPLTSSSWRECGAFLMRKPQGYLAGYTEVLKSASSLGDGDAMSSRSVVARSKGRRFQGSVFVSFARVSTQWSCLGTRKCS